jgi:hypothetical protein
VFLALRGLPVLLEIGLLVFCLIECIQTPADEVRNLPKTGWVLLIIILPLIGGIAWLVAGRPNTRRVNTWRVGGGFPEGERPAARRVVAPDDDPDFLAQMRKVDQEHEEALRRWEQNLKAREAELRRQDPPKDTPDPPSPDSRG